jgi:hypothetical protein
MLEPVALERSFVTLRNWALTRGCEPVGPPFVTLPPALAPRACLPLAQAVQPHPDTEVRLDVLPGGHFAVVYGVPLGEVYQRLEELIARLAPNTGLPAPAEFESAGEPEGHLRLPLRTPPLIPLGEVELRNRVTVEGHPSAIAKT